MVTLLLSMAPSVVIVAALTFVLFRISKKYPAQLENPKYKTGFGPMLLLLMAGEVATILRLCSQCVYLYKSLNAIGASVADRIVILVPSVVSLMLALTVIAVLVTSRRASAPALSIIALWVKGPVLVPLQAWFFSQSVHVMTLTEIYAWALLWTVYLVFSPRVALTYGTRRGRRLTEEKP